MIFEHEVSYDVVSLFWIEEKLVFFHDNFLSNSFDNEIETRGFSTEWAKFFRRIFNRRTKFRSQRLEEEMKNLSSTLMKQSQTTETLTSEPKTDNNHEVCLFSESPHYIVRVS